MAKNRSAKGPALGGAVDPAATAAGQSAESLALIARCLGVIALRLSPKKHKQDAERIRFLSRLGFSDRQVIADILGTTAATVSSRLSERKSKKSPKVKKSQKPKMPSPSRRARSAKR